MITAAERLWAAGVAGPVSIDLGNLSSTTAGTSPSVTWSHTCAPDVQALAVCVTSSGSGGGVTSSVSYNGVPLSNLGNTQISGGLFFAWHVLFNPPTGAAYNIVGTLNTSGYGIYGVGIGLKNCTFVGAFNGSSGASSTAQSATTTSAPTGLVLSAGGVYPVEAVNTPAGSTTLTSIAGISRLTICSQPGTGSNVTSSYSVASAGQFSVASIDAH